VRLTSCRGVRAIAARFPALGQPWSTLGRPIDDAALVFQHTLSASTFSLSYLALVLFGLAVPRDRWLGAVLSVFLVAGTLITGVLGFAAPPAWHPQLDAGQGFGFLIGFGLAAAWLRSTQDPPPSPHPRTES
jgi:hypothetical protein